jgi:tRNA threonylcarbamoyladenosine biosynthesis protein TsaE
MISEVELERVTVHSLEELRTFWTRVLEKYFGPRTLCLLIGPMGAGKTECLKQVSQIGHFGEVASPSFAIHHRAKNSQGKTLDHVDLFRLESQEDLEGTGFWDLFEITDSWIFVEWGDLVAAESWPYSWPTLILRINKQTETSRQLSLSRLIR